MIYSTVRFNHLLVGLRYTIVMLHETFRPNAYGTIKFKPGKSGIIFSRPLYSRNIKQVIYCSIYSLLIQHLEIAARIITYFTHPVNEFPKNVYFFYSLKLISSCLFTESNLQKSNQSERKLKRNPNCFNGGPLC